MSRRKGRTLLFLMATLTTYMCWRLYNPDAGSRGQMTNLATLLVWILCMILFALGAVAVEKSWRDRKDDE